MRPKGPRFAGVAERRWGMMGGMGYVDEDEEEDEMEKPTRSPRAGFATMRLRDSPPTKALNRPQLAEQGQ
jgi:hypothetical protein